MPHAQVEHVPQWFSDEVTELWSLVDPSSGSAFAMLDQIVGARLLNSARKLSGKQPGSNAHALDLDRIVADVNATQPSIAKAFILGEAAGCASKLIGIGLGAKDEPPEAFGSLFGMLGRAAIICRLASAASSSLIGAAQADSAGELDFWLSAIASRGGYWSKSETPTQLDLFDRGASAASEWEEATGAADLASFLESVGAFFHDATSFGVVGSWVRNDPSQPMPAAA